MIPELGHFALILALLLAALLATVPMVGAQRGFETWMALARPAAAGVFVFVAIAFGCLAWSFAHDDFSVLNVATNSSVDLPLRYKLAATWGSHEGSMLLWLLLLCGWTLAVALSCGKLPRPLAARALGVLGLVASGFALFILFTSNPFVRLFPPAGNGRDLNPLLQDPGMVFHPPLLYMGYVGFAVSFAFAIAALLGGPPDAAWARRARPWTLTAWCFLTGGIVLGSTWAYYELGWGGWWFWDPVENASFMPWLVGTALLHSLAVTDRRGSFAAWSALLAIGAFSLSLLGTFLVRSGVLSSVHAFATDPRRGVFILAFLALVIGGSLALFAWRAPRAGAGGAFSATSRESLLLANNVLLTVAAASVFLGTLYPLLLDALGFGRLSVGPPYYEAVFVPVMAPLALLLAAGPLARWGASSARELGRRLRVPLALAAGGTAMLWFALPGGSPLAVLGIFLALWIAAGTVAGAIVRLRGDRRPGTSRPTPSRGFWGMTVAHCGVAVFIFGVTMVRSHERSEDVTVKPGETTILAGDHYRFDGIAEEAGPNYRATRATFIVSRDGRTVTTMRPEKRMYSAGGMPMTEAAIDRRALGDRYVSLGEAREDGAWTARIQWKPFVAWIWAGGLLMAFGALLAAIRRRGDSREIARGSG